MRTLELIEMRRNPLSGKYEMPSQAQEMGQKLIDLSDRVLQISELYMRDPRDLSRYMAHQMAIVKKQGKELGLIFGFGVVAVQTLSNITHRHWGLMPKLGLSAIEAVVILPISREVVTPLAWGIGVIAAPPIKMFGTIIQRYGDIEATLRPAPTCACKKPSTFSPR